MIFFQQLLIIHKYYIFSLSLFITLSVNIFISFWYFNFQGKRWTFTAFILALLFLLLRIYDDLIFLIIFLSQATLSRFFSMFQPNRSVNCYTIHKSSTELNIDQHYNLNLQRKETLPTLNDTITYQRTLHNSPSIRGLRGQAEPNISSSSNW